jgi:murein DD-endopeptidase MepM/ murein hydrolase activator NlpD
MHQEKSRILAQLRAVREAWPGHVWAVVGVASISVFGVVAAFGTTPAAEMHVPQQTVTEQLAVIAVPAESDEGHVFVREERVERGDTVANLLARLGVADESAFRYLRQARETQAVFTQLRPGRVVTARVGANGALHELIFPLGGERDRALFVERKGDVFVASEQDLRLETVTEMKSAEIEYSLFGATDAAGVPENIAIQLADIFGGDVDFHRDLRKGDRFTVTYEMHTHLGRPVSSGRILAAEFINGGKLLRAVWFQGSDGKGGYYTADGRNLRKTFLRSPLEFSRVTSGFSLSRFHPILQKWRAHKGVDYGAPIGTRVRATGDGMVEFVGNQGGFGRVIILRHQAAYTTVYGHLSGFAAGLKKGSRVAQGDTIGYVGQSGWATGPHLHYEFRINGVFKNPLAVGLPEAPPLAAEQRQLFAETAGARLARIELIKRSGLAASD